MPREGGTKLLAPIFHLYPYGILAYPFLLLDYCNCRFTDAGTCCRIDGRRRGDYRRDLCGGIWRRNFFGSFTRNSALIRYIREMKSFYINHKLHFTNWQLQIDFKFKNSLDTTHKIVINYFTELFHGKYLWWNSLRSVHIQQKVLEQINWHKAFNRA